MKTIPGNRVKKHRYTQEYLDGYNAYLDGVSRWTNPYVGIDLYTEWLYNEWNAGYDQSKADHLSNVNTKDPKS